MQPLPWQFLEIDCTVQISDYIIMIIITITGTVKFCFFSSSKFLIKLFFF